MNSPELQEPQPQPAPAVEPPPASASPASRRAMLTPSRVLAAVAIVLALLVWLFTYRQINGLEGELAKRLGAFETRNSESRLLAAQAQEVSRELQAKIALLEQKIVESQNQQVALEAMYQELARGRDEMTLAEVEQLLFAASQQLQVSGNVKAALIALQTADGRLQRLDKPQFHSLRKAITKDIERLRVAPAVDIGGISLRIDEIIEQAEALPLLPGRPKSTKPAEQKPVEGAWWKRFASEAWQDLSQLVRVQNMEKAQLPLLPPEQAYYARENLKLRLLAARLALLARDEASYKRDVKAAQAWMKHYFDETDKGVKNAVSMLQQLGTSPVRVDVPEISGSLSAVRGFKLAPDRSAR